MPYVMAGLPLALLAAGWTVKIYEKEAREHPHVTLRRRGQVWRLNRSFLDRDPPGRLVPPELLVALDRRWPELCEAWDRMHPENPVGGEGDA